MSFLDVNIATWYYFLFLQFNVMTANTTLFENDGFDKRQIADGPVRQLSWLIGTNFIVAITNSSVRQSI